MIKEKCIIVHSNGFDRLYLKRSFRMSFTRYLTNNEILKGMEIEGSLAKSF